VELGDGRLAAAKDLDELGPVALFDQAVERFRSSSTVGELDLGPLAMKYVTTSARESSHADQRAVAVISSELIPRTPTDGENRGDELAEALLDVVVRLSMSLVTRLSTSPWE